MQATNQKQGQPQQATYPMTLAEQRQQFTPEESDNWFDSQQSDAQILNSDEQKEEKTENVQNLLNSVLSIPKDELHQSVLNKEIMQTNEKNQSQKIAKENIQKLKLEKQKEYKIFRHKLDQKLSLLLLNMMRKRLVNLQEISELKDNGVVELFNKNKQIIVKTTNKTTADEAINRLSDFIDDLNVMRLQIKPYLINKLQKFKKIRAQLTKRKIILFSLQNVKQQRGLYIGGLIKPSQLKKTQQQIRNYTIFTIRLYKFANRRTYKIILDTIFQFNMIKKAMMKFSSVSLLEVDMYNKNKQINVIMNMQSKVDIPPTEFQDFIVKHVKKFFVVTFILQTENYLPKLAVKQNTEIRFIYINQRNNRYKKITYLLVIAQIDTFYYFFKEIQNEIEKVGSLIFGIRFFNNLFPNFRLFTFDPIVYYVNKFPKNNTYSMIVSAKQKEGKKYYWRQTFHMFLQMKKLMQKTEVQERFRIQQDQS